MNFRSAFLSPRWSRVLAIALCVAGTFTALGVLIRLASDGTAAFQSRFAWDPDSARLPYGDLPQPFELWHHLSQLFGGVPPVCIAFALAAIFAAWARRSPIPRDHVSRLVLVACGFYALEGVLAVGQQLPMLGMTVRALGFQTPGLALTSVSALFVGLLAMVIPFVYAAAVYALHLHFARLLVFEEEVA